MKTLEIYDGWKENFTHFERNYRFLALFVWEISKDKVRIDTGIDLKLCQINPQYLHTSVLYCMKAIIDANGGLTVY